MNVVVSGTSSGIGLEIARRLLERGDRVWGLARSGQPLDGTPRFASSRCDVADWKQVEDAARAIAAAWTQVDALIACAGIQGEVGRCVTTDPGRWSATVRANLDGTYHVIRALHPLLRPPQRRAKIICFSGGGATKARPQFSAYGVAKTGVVRLVETIAAEEGGALDINAVAPGAVATRLTDEVIALGPAVAGQAEYDAAVKLKKSGNTPMPQAVALVEWLLSPESDGITGRLFSAAWDPFKMIANHRDALTKSDIYQLRRIVPEDRGKDFRS